MFLSDQDIQQALERGEIVISDFQEANMNPASYSLTLGPILYKLKQKEFLDSRINKQDYEEITVSPEKGYALQPGEFLIARSAEKITLATTIGGILATAGSRAQQGLDAIQSSTFMEPGSDNHMALELHNSTQMPILLFPGVRIVKAAFFRTQTASAYQGRHNDFFRRQGIY